MKRVIYSNQAPAAIGAYSQAIQCGPTIYISGQIPLHPENMQLVEGGFKPQIQQIFLNLQALCGAAGGSLKDIVKLTIYLRDLENFSMVNQVMTDYFEQPFPARATIGVSALPKGAEVEIDAIMVLESP